ncbi:kinase-like domain-containing protein [Mycena metata]|uniref:Kinase-like domain-containing protein n=1 Tax=Mycena metata TaxID=1033252 RepID=A0AAD7MID0_9AGAR|nr:kinase-like domain-containing protein [Mycena metata]
MGSSPIASSPIEGSPIGSPSGFSSAGSGRDSPSSVTSSGAVTDHRPTYDVFAHQLELGLLSLYKEAHLWISLEHPNVLPFLGVALDLGLSPALVFPLCSPGPIMKYLQFRPLGLDAKQKLQMAIDVAAGLAYLHSQGIIHGNLSTKKVLIHENGAPVISGYGISKTLRQPTISTTLFSSPIRFAPPEGFSAEAGPSPPRTASGDVYSFAMVILEILSGLEPFHHLLTEHAVFMHIVRGDRPIRNDLDPQVVTDRIWRVLTGL